MTTETRNEGEGEGLWDATADGERVGLRKDSEFILKKQIFRLINEDLFLTLRRNQKLPIP